MSSIVDRYYNAPTELRDSIKTLRANISFASLDKGIKSVAFTSVVPSEGKTTTSCFLGIAMAEAEKKTLIVECDYRHPMVGRNFEIEATKGLMNYLSGEDEIEDCVTPTEIADLYVLDTTTKIKNPVELISSPAFSEMVKVLRDKFDFIIYDTPPLGAFIDAAHISSQVDGAIIVIRQGQVDRRAAKEVIDQLKKANANIIGSVINAVEVKKSSYYYYHYYHNYRYGYGRYGKYNKYDRYNEAYSDKSLTKSHKKSSDEEIHKSKHSHSSGKSDTHRSKHRRSSDNSEK